MKVEKDKRQVALARIRAKVRAAQNARQPQPLGNTGLVVRPALTDHFARLQISSPPSDIPRTSAISLLTRFYKLNRLSPAPISATLQRPKDMCEAMFHPARWQVVCYGRFLATIILNRQTDKHAIQLRYRDSDNKLHWLASTEISLSSQLFFKKETLLARFKRTIQTRQFYMARDTHNQQIPL